MNGLYVSEFHLLKNILNALDENKGPLTPKEKFALIWLLVSGIIIGTCFLVFLYILATTYEFKEFSMSFEMTG